MKISIQPPIVRRVKIFAADGRLLTDCLIADPARSFHSIVEDIRFIHESPFAAEIIGNDLQVNLA